MIYLDYNATTPCAPEVISAMLPYFTDKFGNAGSVTHAMGWTASEAVKIARQNIANYLNCDSEEIYFTSGATESCNMAIQGVFAAYQHKGKEIICIATEHKAVLDTYEHLSKLHGAIVKVIPVDRNGIIDYEVLEAAITSQTILISAMFANNETGVVNDISKIGTIARANKVLFFCDATQALGKTAIDLSVLPIDILAASAHKIYGPKGIGFIYLKRKNPRVTIIPRIWGGGQERGKRSGTLNVPGIIGLSAAITVANSNQWLEEVAKMRSKLEESLLSIHPHFKVNGDCAQRLPHVTNIALEGIKAEQLLSKINHTLCISLGSACAAAQQGPSHVLIAMGLNKEELDGSIRISMGRYTTSEEIDQAIEIIKENTIKLLK